MSQAVKKLQPDMAADQGKRKHLVAQSLKEPQHYQNTPCQQAK
jgi:hypothetical protein